MERTVKDYEVKGEHKLIREITKTYVTVGGVERLWNTHRGTSASTRKTRR